MRRALDRPPRTRENYLIAAAPGSGKTFFVQEVAKSINGVEFVELDLNKHGPREVSELLTRADAATRPCLCMIDEIDGKPDEAWPFSDIYKSLDWNDTDIIKGRTFPIVFVLIGSSTCDPKDLRLVISKGHKGKDLIDRIADTTEYCVHVPPLEVGDGICVYVSKLLEAASKAHTTVTHVSRFAAYHAALSALSSPRQIKMLADHAVERARGSRVIQFDHHFDAEDDSKSRFLEEHRSAKAELGSSQIDIGAAL